MMTNRTNERTDERANVSPCEMPDSAFRVWASIHGIRPRHGDVVYRTKQRAQEVIAQHPDACFACAVPFHSQGIHGWVIRANKAYYQRKQKETV